LEQLEALQEEEPEAESIIDDEWPSVLERQVQQLRDSHQQAVDDGRLMGHAPVLLYTAMEFLFPLVKRRDDFRFDGNYADCTFGRGSHAREILARLSGNGRLFAFEIDPDAVEIGRALEREDSRFQIVHRPYGDISTALQGVELDGAVMDIGVSSPQLDEWDRGFSLQSLESAERPFDLRMNPDSGIPASEWLQGVSVEELAHVFDTYGPEGEFPLVSERIAQAIMDDQKANGPFTSMNRFADVVMKAKGLRGENEDEDMEHPSFGADHPAKLWVQALRLHLNQELEQLAVGLGEVMKLIKQGGRVVVATFKRSEADVIRRFLLEHEDPDPEIVARIKSKRRLVELYPLVGTDLDYSVKLLGGKPIRASNAEISRNRRARSSSLFILEKAPRLSKQVKARPRLLRNRFKEPKVGTPVLVHTPEDPDLSALPNYLQAS